MFWDILFMKNRGMNLEQEQLKNDAILANELQTEIFKGLARGVPPVRLLLKALQCLSLQKGSNFSFEEIKEKAKLVYGDEIDRELSRKEKIQEAEEREERLQKAFEREQDSDDKKMVIRLKNAVRMNREEAEFLRKEHWSEMSQEK